MNRNPSRQNIVVLALALLAVSCNAFTVRTSQSMLRGDSRRVPYIAFLMSPQQRDDDHDGYHCPAESRRSVLSSILTSTTTVVVTTVELLPNDVYAEAETMERGGVPLTPFNSLAFNYRGAYRFLFFTKNHILMIDNTFYSVQNK